MGRAGKDAHTWTHSGGVLHVLSGEKCHIPAKPLRVLNIIPSYTFVGDPAAGQGKHREV